MKRFFERLLGRGGRPLAEVRWAVVDCETSGLDMRHDRLLAVGAVAVHGGRIDYGDAFAATVRQESASAPENILVHGIGGDAQRAGLPLAEVMARFETWLGAGAPVAFHAPFDAAFLKRPIAFDLAQILPALYPRLPHKSLDEWLAAFGIEAPGRHDALGDAAATAALLLVALAEAARQGAATDRALARLARDGRWTG